MSFSYLPSSHHAIPILLLSTPTSRSVVLPPNGLPNTPSGLQRLLEDLCEDLQVAPAYPLRTVGELSQRARLRPSPLPLSSAQH